MRKVQIYTFQLFGLFVLIGGLSVQEGYSQGILREVIDRMDKHYRALQTMQSNIDRSITNPQLGTTDPMSGKIVMMPGKGRNFAMRLDWAKPKVETLSIVNGQYVLYVPSIKRAYYGSSDSTKVSKNGGSALSALNMSEAEMRANYDSTMLSDDAKLRDGTRTFHLKLVPKTRKNFKEAQLWVDTDGMPRQAMIVAHNGDTDTFFLSAVKKNEKVNSSIFKVAVPGDAEKIKQ